MRVIAGEARGRRLQAPKGEGVRPTSDRVREAMFNALGSLDAVVGADVVDLFAGTGALGIEALSRGAAHVTFVERERAALSVLEPNVAHTGFTDRSRIVRGDALVAIGGLPQVDLALLDPPYSFDKWPELLERLRARWIVIESSVSVALGDRWSLVREKRYGTTVVAIAHAVNEEP